MRRLSRMAASSSTMSTEARKLSLFLAIGLSDVGESSKKKAGLRRDRPLGLVRRPAAAAPPLRHPDDGEEGLRPISLPAGAEGVEAQEAARLGTAHGLLEVVHVVDGLAVDLADDVARAHPLVVEGAGGRHVGDDDALDAARQAVPGPHLGGEVLVLDAEPVDTALAAGLAVLRLRRLRRT